MRLTYDLDKKYLAEVGGATDIDSLGDLLEWPEGNLQFESEKQSMKGYDIKPDTFFWWLDWLIGQFEHEVTNIFDEDMNGSVYRLRWENSELSVYELDKNHQHIGIFQEHISKEALIESLMNLAKELRNTIEKNNPLVKKSSVWNSYSFVKND